MANGRPSAAGMLPTESDDQIKAEHNELYMGMQTMTPEDLKDSITHFLPHDL